MSIQSRVIALLLCPVPALAALGACSGGGNSEEPSQILPYPPGQDAGSVPDVAESGSRLSTSMRLANLAPWLGSIDICVEAPGTGTFLGPLLTPGASGGGGDAGPTDAGDAGLDALIGVGEGGAPDEGSAVDGTSSSPDSDVQESGSLEGEASSDSGSSEGDSPDAGSLADASAFDGGAREAGEAGPSPTRGLPPLTVSRYILLTGVAGTFEIAIVPAGSGSCGAPILTQLVTLDPGKSTTVVLTESSSMSPDSGLHDAGEDGASGSSGPVALLSFTDEPDAVMGLARTRFINVARSPSPYAVGSGLSVAVVGHGNMAWPLASIVDPGLAASPSSVPPMVDALGYHESLPIDPLVATLGSRKALRVTPVGGPPMPAWTSAFDPLDLGSKSVHTGLISAGSGGGFAVLWCDDLAMGSTGSCVWIGEGHSR